MSVPLFTLTYLAVLALIYSVLALIVVVLRGKYDIPFGHGNNALLERAIRAHGNFIEWVPMTALLIAGLEVSGQPTLHIHVMMGALLVARVLHPIALFSKLGSRRYFVGRIAGATTTWLTMTAAAVMVIRCLV